MAKLVLEVQKREKSEKVRFLRADRIVPANVYGKTQEATSLKIDASDLLRAYRTAGWSNIVTLQLDGEEIEVLFNEIQKEPVSGEIIHADFYALTRGEKLTAKISLNFIGSSAAVKEGALLNENVKELEVTCLPKDLVDGFDVDLAALVNFDDVIRLWDLALDADKYEVHHLHDEDAIVVASKPAVAEDLDAPIADVAVTGAETEEEKAAAAAKAAAAK